MGSFEYRKFPFAAPEELTAGRPVRHPVIVVGAGPVGLGAAIDLALRGIPAIVLDDEDQVSEGSRAICWARRTLEIWDRLGCAGPMEEKGITWQIGRVFHGERELYSFDLLPEPGYGHPAFINLQQYYAEAFLIERLEAVAGAGVRWLSRVAAVEDRGDHMVLSVDTPEGRYTTECDWLIACDGARSTVRDLLDLEFVGRYFEDRFLIADVRMKADFPTERWFWYHPPFHPGPSTLMHRQADNVFRIDFQLGPDVDPDEEMREENVAVRIKRMLGEDVAFDFEWISIYRFQARRLEKFRHGRTLFAGDAAHQVSPFGARGGNSGIPDAENLVWKLALVIGGQAPEALLDSYDAERVYAAAENLRVTSGTTDFMSAKSAAGIAYRDAALGLAVDWPFARAFVNAGRLSVATVHRDSPLNTPDEAVWDGACVPGAVLDDAPVTALGDGGGDWLLNHVGGDFACLYFHDGGPLPGGVAAGLAALAAGDLPVRPLLAIPVDAVPPAGLAAIVDRKGLAARRLDAGPGACYLIRPDQTVAGRWRGFDAGAVDRALARATCRAGGATARMGE